MSIYTKHVSGLQTPQTEQATKTQVKNYAGGYVFELDCWGRLDRFLILGTEGGTYYATEKEITVKAAGAVRECLGVDFKRTIRRIVEVSDSGRAPKNDPAIFALAMAASNPDTAVRKHAFDAMPQVCRIGTHLFHFVAALKHFRGWSRGSRKAVARWYTSKPIDKLALQLVKYQQRDGWSHRDLLRLSHAKALTREQNALFRWVTYGLAGLSVPTKKSPAKYYTDELPTIVGAFETLKKLEDSQPKLAVELIVKNKLPHECVPNELKSKPEIWEAMLPHMGLTAMIRGLGKMTSVRYLKPMSVGSQIVCNALRDEAELKRQRVHPMQVLLALSTYRQGHGMKGSLVWEPLREIVDALDDAFYLSFSTIEPTGKNHLLALDVSGSMGDPMNGTSLSCREAAAAMAMVTARTEQNWHCMGFSDRFVTLPISPRQRLDDVVKVVSNLPFSRTDCALPMLYASGEDLEIDVFEVFTDNETYFGNVHPFQALRAYRAKSGRAAKLIVVGMTATPFTIADPSDAGMLDVVGFDSAAPAIMADFARGMIEVDGARG